jgi:Transposase
VAPLYARTTTRLTATQADTGLVLGGAAGARHLSRHGLPGSRNTLLRRVRSLGLPEGPEPAIIGIDDWAWRKGHRYGTIIVDLQRGCPIDLLEDRAAETVATWLQAHPDVQIVARDRAEAYASGVRQGAPEATQVADRFHLLKNLASALQEVFNGHHREIDQLNHLLPCCVLSCGRQILISPCLSAAWRTHRQRCLPPSVRVAVAHAHTGSTLQ